MEYSPIEVLRKARLNLVQGRRAIATSLAAVVHKDVSAQWERRFVETQDMIEALDAAIQDEIKMESGAMAAATPAADG